LVSLVCMGEQTDRVDRKIGRQGGVGNEGGYMDRCNRRVGEWLARWPEPLHLEREVLVYRPYPPTHTQLAMGRAATPSKGGVGLPPLPPHTHTTSDGYSRYPFKGRYSRCSELYSRVLD
jgi:hypothetical protein